MNTIDLVHEHLLKNKINGVFRNNDKVFVMHMNRPGRPFEIMEFFFEDTIVTAKSRFTSDLVIDVTSPGSLQSVDDKLERAASCYNHMIWSWEKFGAVLTHSVYGAIVTYRKYDLHQS